MKTTAQHNQSDGLTTAPSIPHGTDTNQPATGYHTAASAVQRLLTGDVELWQLPLPFQQLVYYGFNLQQANAKRDRERLHRELEQTQHEAALAYERLHNPGKQFTELVNRRAAQAAFDNMGEPDAARFYERVLSAACGRGEAA